MKKDNIATNDTTKDRPDPTIPPPQGTPPGEFVCGDVVTHKDRAIHIDEVGVNEHYMVLIGAAAIDGKTIFNSKGRRYSVTGAQIAGFRDGTISVDQLKSAKDEPEQRALIADDTPRKTPGLINSGAVDAVVKERDRMGHPIADGGKKKSKGVAGVDKDAVIERLTAGIETLASRNELLDKENQRLVENSIDRAGEALVGNILSGNLEIETLIGTDDARLMKMLADGWSAHTLQFVMNRATPPQVALCAVMIRSK